MASVCWDLFSGDGQETTRGRDKAFAFNGSRGNFGVAALLHEGWGTYFTYVSFGRRTDCIIFAAFDIIVSWTNQLRRMTSFKGLG
jgi:hypothetical protein